jgi:hypothetical protein
MPLVGSGWIIWNAGSITSPHFIPKQIYPPALQVIELTETVYSTKLQAQAAINKNGGPSKYSTAGAANKPGVPSLPSAVGDTGSALQGINAVGSFTNKLGQRNTWLRVGEFLVGGMLVYVSAKAMFPGQVQAATAPARIAKKAVTKGLI